MRKISILQENYMALEQKIAVAIDQAEKQINEARVSWKSKFDSIKESVKENIHMSSEFINFRFETKIEQFLQETDMKLKKAAAKARKMSSCSLEESAIVSKADQLINGILSEDIENEVSEILSFFESENTNIPDAETNDFIVEINENGNAVALRKLAGLRQLFEDASENIREFIRLGGDTDGFSKDLDNLVIINKLTDGLTK